MSDFKTSASDIEDPGKRFSSQVLAVGGYIKRLFKRLPVQTAIIGGFWVLILIVGATQKVALSDLISDMITRFGLWGLLVLAMVPSIQSGTGPNFALPIGVVCGLLALVCSIEFGFKGIMWLLAAIAMAIVFAVILGYLYGKLMNAVKGSEMTIATYTGFSITYLFCIAWLVLPFRSPIMGWLLGSGLRNTIELKQLGGAQILNNFLSFELFGISIPTGILLVVAAACLLVWLFFRSKTGIAISAVGANPMFARASGLNVNRSRVTANIFSTALAAVGIVIFSQSRGFASLYDAPLMMAFQAVAAILIGGATTQRAKITHVIVGTIIFQGLLTNGPPVLNNIFPDNDLSEIIRMIVQNGIILYALTQVKGGGE
jgi:simple sugar transport system permease protein